MDIDDDFSHILDRRQKKEKKEVDKSKADVYKVDFEEGVLDNKPKVNKKKKKGPEVQQTKNIITLKDALKLMKKVIQDNAPAYENKFDNFDFCFLSVASDLENIFARLSSTDRSSFSHNRDSSYDASALPMAAIPKDIIALYSNWIQNHGSQLNTGVSLLLMAITEDNEKRQTSNIGLKFLLQLVLRSFPDSANDGVIQVATKLRTQKTLSERIVRDLLYLGNQLLKSSIRTTAVQYLIELVNPLLNHPDYQILSNFVNEVLSALEESSCSSINTTQRSLQDYLRAMDLHSPPLYGSIYQKNRKALHSKLTELLITAIKYQVDSSTLLDILLNALKTLKEINTDQDRDVLIQCVISAFNDPNTIEVYKMTYPQYFFETFQVLKYIADHKIQIRTSNFRELMLHIASVNGDAIALKESKKKKKKKVFTDTVEISDLVESTNICHSLAKISRKFSGESSTSFAGHFTLLLMLIFLSVIFYYSLSLANQVNLWDTIKNSQPVKFIESHPFTLKLIEKVQRVIKQ